MSPLWLCKVCAVFSVNCLICDRYTLLIIGTEKIVHVRCTVRAINFHHNWLWKIQSSLFSYSFSSVTYSSFSSSTSPPSESAPPSPPPSPVHPNWIHQLLVVWYRNFVYLEFGTLAEFDSDFLDVCSIWPFLTVYPCWPGLWRAFGSFYSSIVYCALERGLWILTFWKFASERI